MLIPLAEIAELLIWAALRQDLIGIIIGSGSGVLVELILELIVGFEMMFP